MELPNTPNRHGSPRYGVHIKRIQVSHQTIYVDADSAIEAVERALEQAPNTCYPHVKTRYRAQEINPVVPLIGAKL
jgi:hypothetical protein